jgi:hypothetical protein
MRPVGPEQPSLSPRGRNDAIGQLTLLEVWPLLCELIPEIKPQRQYEDVMLGEVTTGLPGPLHHALTRGFVETQRATPPAALDDFRVLADFVRAGGLHYLAPQEWCAHLCRGLPAALDKSARWKESGRPELRRATTTATPPRGIPLPSNHPQVIAERERRIALAREEEAREAKIQKDARTRQRDKPLPAQGILQGLLSCDFGTALDRMEHEPDCICIRCKPIGRLVKEAS